MAGNTKKLLEMLIGIGGKINSTFKQSTAEAGKDIDTLEAKAQKLGVAVRMNNLKAAYDKLDKAAGGVSKSWGSLTKEISGTAKTAAAAVAGVTTAVYGVATVSGLAGDKMAKTAAKIGITTQSYSELTWAASLAGVSQDSLSGNLLKLNARMDEAAKGGKDAQLAFRRLGVEIKDSTGTLKSADQILMEAAATFEKMPKGIYKASLARAVFGKSGAEMIPLLQQGTRAIEAQRKEAEELKISWDDAAGQGAENFMDSMNRMKQVGLGLSNVIGRQLHPILTKINNTIVDWWKAHNNHIQSKVAEIAAKLSDSLPALITKIEAAAAWIQETAIYINGIAQAMGGWEGVIHKLAIAWGVLKGVMILSKLGSLVSGLISLAGALSGATVAAWSFAAALMANPITWIVIGIMAAVAAIYLLWKNWDSVSAFIKRTWAAVCDWVGEKWEALSGWLMGQWNSITAAFDEGVIQGIWNLIKTFNPISMFLNIVNGMVKSIFGIDLLAKGKEWIGGFISGILEAIGGAAGKVQEKIMSMLPDWLSGGGGENEKTPYVRAQDRIPGYARGGYIDRPELAWLGEKGPEMVIPMDRSKRSAELLTEAAQRSGAMNPLVSSISASAGRLGPIQPPAESPSDSLGQAIGQSTTNNTFGGANITINLNVPVNNSGGRGDINMIEEAAGRAAEMLQDRLPRILKDIEYQYDRCSMR